MIIESESLMMLIQLNQIIDYGDKYTGDCDDNNCHIYPLNNLLIVKCMNL